MTMRPRTTRVISALVLAIVLGGGAVSQAQIYCTIPCPIWDPQAILRNIAINTLKTELNTVLNDQQQRFVTMAKRLVTLTPLKKYLIPMDDTPAWRIHDWFPGNVLYANTFHYALTYGDHAGTGYDSVALPRIGGDAEALSRLSPAAAAYLRGELAMLDIADSTIIRGTDDNGRQRFNGREESRTIDLLQQAVTNDDDQLSITAVMDTISAAGLMEARNKQARIQLEAATLEQLTLDNMRDRNSATMQMNMTLNQLRDAGQLGRALIQGSENHLRTWRQP
jgi:hypothetical protein